MYKIYELTCVGCADTEEEARKLYTQKRDNNNSGEVGLISSKGEIRVSTFGFPEYIGFKDKDSWIRAVRR